MTFKVSFLYFFGFYVIPVAVYYLIGGHTNFKPFSLSLEYYLFFICTLIFILITFFSLKKVTLKNFNLINIFKPNVVWLTLAIFSIPIALHFYINFGLTYRQTGDGLANSGIIPKIIFIIKPFFTAYVFYHIFSGQVARDIQVNITKSLILLFFILTISSSFEALLILILGFNVFLKGFFYKLFLINTARNMIISFISNIKMMFIGCILLASIIFVGIANKTGFDDSFEYFSNSSVVSKLSYYLYYRVSVYNSSLAIHINDSPLTLNKSLKSTSILLDNIIYRFNLLAGQKTVRPYLTNINRFNYLYIHQRPKTKEIGASPGVFASFIIAFPILLSPVICGIYLGVLVSLISRVKPNIKNKSYSWVAAFFIYYFLFTFLHSPINNLFTVGPEPIKLILYAQTLFLIVRNSEQGNR